MKFVLSLLAGGFSFGPVGSVFSVMWTGIKTLVSWIWQGLELCITHPVAWIIVAIGVLVGVHMGKAWDAHLVEAAKIKAANVVAKVQGASDVEKSKAEAAIAARDAAENEAKKIAAEAQAKIFPLLDANASVASDHPVKAAAPTIALNPGPTAAELRNAKRVRHSSKCAALFCF